MSNVLNYRPTTWPRCRQRPRVAEVLINGKHRLCAEAYRNGDGSDIVVIWPETFVGRNWKQVGRAFPMPAAALEAIVDRALEMERWWRYRLTERPMKVSERFAPKYFTGAGLRDREVCLRVSHVDEDVEMGPKRELKDVLYFLNDDRGLVLNKTNATTLAMAFGDDSEGLVWSQYHPPRGRYTRRPQRARPSWRWPCRRPAIRRRSGRV